MTIYNNTIKIDRDCVKDWLIWQRDHQIPEIMATGLFFAHELFRLMDQDDSEGYTYVSQFRAKSFAQLKTFLLDHESRFDQQSNEKWSGRFVSFQSRMDLVQ